jgi:phosphoenolpyruvate synthase/pyruvate phosphate dikinase
MEKLVIPFDQLSIKDLGKVGGKNASLGELHRYLRPLASAFLMGFLLLLQDTPFFFRKIT